MWLYWYYNCRAYPDEKGIETPIPSSEVCFHLDCRAYPDEKGIETNHILIGDSGGFQNCRAYPDEKGIETQIGSPQIGSLQIGLQSLSR